MLLYYNECMILALISLLIVVGLAIILMKSLKLFFLASVFAILLITCGVYIAKPIQHKQFAIQVIDYLIKFNTDGSITTTKQTTTTQIQRDGQ